MSKEAMKLALEALVAAIETAKTDVTHYAAIDFDICADAIQKGNAALEALAKQEQDSTCNDTLRDQGKAYPRTCKKCGFGPCIGKPKQEQGEPVGEILLTNGDYKEVSWKKGKLPTVGTKLYTTPQQRKPLTDEQLMIALLGVDHETKRLPSGFRAFARAIEAAHGIKE